MKDENVKNLCLSVINEIYAEIEKRIDFGQPKLQLQAQRGNLTKELMENAGDKCVEIINSNYSKEENTSDIIKFVNETIIQKRNELLGL